VTGTYHNRNLGTRLFDGPILIVYGKATNAVEIVSQPPEDAFAGEPLDQSRWIAPKDVASLGRHTVEGIVLARWDNRNFALRTVSGDTIVVRLRDAQSAPPPGLRVSAAGYPETDLYRLHLTRAVCREAPDPADWLAENPVRITAEQIFHDEKGRPRFGYNTYNGQLVTLSGTVRQPSAGESGLHLNLDCGTRSIPVDIDRLAAPTLAGLEPESKVEITGVCLMECETWSPNLIFPHIKGCRLFVRRADEVRILSRPPWWTPLRLAVVIGILVLGIIGFAVWSAALRRLVQRRSRELLREQIAHVESDLRADERTRLAVELHDALSQNLEGVAFQIAAAKDLMGVSSDASGRTLDAANRMLLSSRTELKRCLFDLRHDALGADSFDQALRTTLDPISGDAELTIRFAVPRDIFTDTSAHLVLCIIRELVSNAIRHGQARHIRIAGEWHDGQLSFSVRDDGTGFDSSRCPGPDEGHFGLEGIRERVRRLGGRFTIDSVIGGPTRAVVIADIGHPQQPMEPSK